MWAPLGSARAGCPPSSAGFSVRRCVQVAFTRTPSVEFDLRLLGGNMTSLPFLEDWLQGTLRSLLEPYTLPDKV